MAGNDYEYYEGVDRMMGTVFRLYALHPPGKREWMKDLADRFFDSLEKDDNRLSLYVRDSLVNRINRAAGLEPVAVDRDTFELLVVSKRFWRMTGGLFDITCGALMRAYGYYRNLDLPGEELALEAGAPSAKGRAAVKELTGPEKLELDERNLTVRLARKGMLLDLGGIAKGWCVEQRARDLLSSGLEDFIISAGTSTVLARGAPPGEQGWASELEGPDMNNGITEYTLLINCAVSVSGNYRNTHSSPGGITVRHIMNPITLEPVEEIRQAVVAGPEASECEALSTAFLIQGELDGFFSLQARPDITVHIKRIT